MPDDPAATAPFSWRPARRRRCGARSRSARISACSSHTGPRARLIRRAEGFIAPRIPSSKIPRVSRVSGTGSTRKSASAAAAANCARGTCERSPDAAAACRSPRSPSCRRSCSARPGPPRSARRPGSPAVQQPLVELVPDPAALIAPDARVVARQAEHVQEGHLGDGRAVHAVAGGDRHASRQRGQPRERLAGVAAARTSIPGNAARMDCRYCSANFSMTRMLAVTPGFRGVRPPRSPATRARPWRACRDGSRRAARARP